MADSSVTQIGYAIETTFGTTPSAALKVVPVTSFNWGYTQETFSSQRHLGDPQRRRTARQMHNSAPSFNTELSFGDMDDFLQVFLRASGWQADTPVEDTQRLENGIIRTSMTLEAHYPDISKFISAKGCRPGAASISIQKGGMATCSFGFTGLPPVAAGTTVGTGTRTAAADNETFSGVESLTLVEEGGSTLGDLLGIEININNGTRLKSVLNSATPTAIGAGEFTVGGSISLYFEDTDVWAKALARTVSSLQVVAEDSTGNELLMHIPRLYFTGGSPDMSGPYVDIELPLTFEAEKDPTSGKTIWFERTAYVEPD